MGDGRLRALLRTGQSGEKTVHLCGELDLVTALGRVSWIMVCGGPGLRAAR